MASVSFAVPLLLGFTFNLLSAFTTFYSERWAQRNGTIITRILRAGLGIPLWGLGLVLAFNTSASRLFAPTMITTLIGLAGIAAGATVIYFAFKTLKTVALSPSLRDGLIQSGIYSRIRHPMDAGTILAFWGLFLLRPTSVMLAASAIGTVWALAQARVEELDLLRRLPDYRGYMQRVPRFLPKEKGL